MSVKPLWDGRRPIWAARITTNGCHAGAGAGTPAQSRNFGGGPVRPFHPRALCDRCVPLPDDAAWRRFAAHRRGGRARARACARGTRHRAGARRGNLTERADRQPFAGGRLLEVSQPHRRARRCGPALRGRARHRARRSQPRAQAAWPVVPGRCLDRFARHHRGHDGKQLLRRTLAALRQYARERAGDRRRPGGWQPSSFRAGGARPVRCAGGAAPARRRSPGARCARGRRGRGTLSAGPAPSRRLQSRCAAARPQRPQPRPYPGRVRGHARVLDHASSSSCHRCSGVARSAPAISAASTRRWTQPSTSSSWRRSRSS